ncbi:hypothetical protein BB560_006839 [Smittium megazygosporum]|uniref:RING-type domain-containing protein n=1 Tax=Smittium megazygosporum TaxID=133381 RepID=A0A2T9Y0Z7_9FUNG|nr:hypothetical protein BB560_006839 [Smittium megazygosporum]
MSDSEDEAQTCPLCMEVMDIDDRCFFPCECDYQICRFCYHRIIETFNGKCPACRRDYKDMKVRWNADFAEQMTKSKAEKKAREREKREQEIGTKKHLANVRVIQRNLAYVVGLPPHLATEEILKGPDYFGQFGKINKIVINKKKIVPPRGGDPIISVGAYVTFASKEDTAAAIKTVDGSTLENRLLRATYGTTKYCTYYLKGVVCQNPNCMYLHEPGEEADYSNREDNKSGFRPLDAASHARAPPIKPNNIQTSSSSSPPAESSKPSPISPTISDTKNTDEFPSISSRPSSSTLKQPPVIDEKSFPLPASASSTNLATASASGPAATDTINETIPKAESTSAGLSSLTKSSKQIPSVLGGGSSALPATVSWASRTNSKATSSTPKKSGFSFRPSSRQPSSSKSLSTNDASSTSTSTLKKSLFDLSNSNLNSRHESSANLDRPNPISPKNTSTASSQSALLQLSRERKEQMKKHSAKLSVDNSSLPPTALPISSSKPKTDTKYSSLGINSSGSSNTDTKSNIASPSTSENRSISNNQAQALLEAAPIPQEQVQIKDTETAVLSSVDAKPNVSTLDTQSTTQPTPTENDATRPDISNETLAYSLSKTSDEPMNSTEISELSNGSGLATTQPNIDSVKINGFESSKNTFNPSNIQFQSSNGLLDDITSSQPLFSPWNTSTRFFSNPQSENDPTSQRFARNPLLSRNLFGSTELKDQGTSPNPLLSVPSNPWRSGLSSQSNYNFLNPGLINQEPSMLKQGFNDFSIAPSSILPPSLTLLSPNQNPALLNSSTNLLDSSFKPQQFSTLGSSPNLLLKDQSQVEPLEPSNFDTLNLGNKSLSSQGSLNLSRNRSRFGFAQANSDIRDPSMFSGIPALPNSGLQTNLIPQIPNSLQNSKYNLSPSNVYQLGFNVNSSLNINCSNDGMKLPDTSSIKSAHNSLLLSALAADTNHSSIKLGDGLSKNASKFDINNPSLYQSRQNERPLGMPELNKASSIPDWRVGMADPNKSKLVNDSDTQPLGNLNSSLGSKQFLLSNNLNTFANDLLPKPNQNLYNTIPFSNINSGNFPTDQFSIKPEATGPFAVKNQNISSLSDTYPNLKPNINLESQFFQDNTLAPASHPFQDPAIVQAQISKSQGSILTQNPSPQHLSTLLSRLNLNASKPPQQNPAQTKSSDAKDFWSQQVNAQSATFISDPAIMSLGKAQSQTLSSHKDPRLNLQNPANDNINRNFFVSDAAVDNTVKNPISSNSSLETASSVRMPSLFPSSQQASSSRPFDKGVGNIDSSVQAASFFLQSEHPSNTGNIGSLVQSQPLNFFKPDNLLSNISSNAGSKATGFAKATQDTSLENKFIALNQIGLLSKDSNSSEAMLRSLSSDVILSDPSNFNNIPKNKSEELQSNSSYFDEILSLLDGKNTLFSKNSSICDEATSEDSFLDNLKVDPVIFYNTIATIRNILQDIGAADFTVDGNVIFENKGEEQKLNFDVVRPSFLRFLLLSKQIHTGQLLLNKLSDSLKSIESMNNKVSYILDSADSPMN